MSLAARLGTWVAAALKVNRVHPQEVRAEVWALGGRHQGRVLEGARAEMKAPGITLRRMMLLQAVARSVSMQDLRSPS